MKRRLRSSACTTGGSNGNPFRHRAPEWDYAIRVSGSRQLPWGFMFASSLVAQSGEWYGRDVQIRDGTNTVVNVRVEPQVARYDWVKIWDNRISKKLKTFGRQSVEGTVDIFNSLNVNTITNQTTRNGSTYLQPTEIIAPRVFRLGVRYRF